MKIRTKRGFKPLVMLAAIAAVSVFALAACGGDDDDTSGNTPTAGATAAATEGAGGTDYSSLSGDIVADGSSTVGPITEAVAEEFGKVSDVRVAVGISGTGGGFQKFCLGETDINDASRPIKEQDEKEGLACAANGIDYVEFKVAIDGLTVVVNPENDFAGCLKYSQLKNLWDTGSTVSNWNELDPGFPDQEIKLFSPGADSGTFDYFTEEINGKSQQARNDSRVTFSEDDNVLVQGVSQETNALGYFGYAYFRESADALKAVEIEKDQNGKGEPVAESGGCVGPTDATINDGSYPLSRPLFLYVSTEALARPEVRGFVEFYLLNAPELVGDVGYVPLPEAEYESGLDQVATAGQ